MIKEKETENLIVNFPKELLKENLFLIEKQKTLLHGRRPDLIFQDKFGRHLIIEIQRDLFDEKHIVRLSNIKF